MRLKKLALERKDSIQLNLDPVAPIGLNGQNLPFEPITILTSRSKCFTFIGGVEGPKKEHN